MVLQKKQFELSLVDKHNKKFMFENNTFYIPHASEYKIKIRNNDSRKRANAKIYVDGKRVGAFRLDKNDDITIERPADRDRKLTFYAVDSIEGLQCNLDALVKSDNIGKLKVVIEIEDVSFRDRCVCRNTVTDSIGGTGLGGTGLGGTGLGDVSAQRFYDAQPILTDNQVVLEVNMRETTIQNLEDLLNVKDARIRQLEEDLRRERGIRDRFINKLNALTNVTPL